MIKLIIGDKGSGKTKRMIDMINDAVANTNGHIVCVEKNMKLTYTISHAVRLIDVDDYGISGYDCFYGFFCGLLASNYDVTEIFVDGILKIGGGIDGLAELLDKIDKLTEKSVEVVVTVSTSPENLTEGVKKYM